MAEIKNSSGTIRLGSSNRLDNWWIEPLWTGLGFFAFVIYTTWAVFEADYYWWSAGAGGFGGYLSPFYSPLVFIEPTALGSAPLSHSLLGSWPTWWPNLIPASPAIFILFGPLSFRLTCYYYRKFYYRAYFMAPPACAVKGIHQDDYKGETNLFIFQNLHRYTMYIALLFIVILSYDALLAFFRNGELGIGVGTVILLLNPIFLAGYTFGCHAFRHVVGGGKDCYTCPKGKPTFNYRIWQGVSWLNSRHQLWAWISMIWVAFADIYVRLVANGTWVDYNTWGY